jgi:hypothetical protein
LVRWLRNRKARSHGIRTGAAAPSYAKGVTAVLAGEQYISVGLSVLSYFRTSVPLAPIEPRNRTSGLRHEPRDVSPVEVGVSCCGLVPEVNACSTVRTNDDVDGTLATTDTTRVPAVPSHTSVGTRCCESVEAAIPSSVRASSLWWWGGKGGSWVVGRGGWVSGWTADGPSGRCVIARTRCTASPGL